MLGKKLVLCGLAVPLFMAIPHLMCTLKVLGLIFTKKRTLICRKKKKILMEKRPGQGEWVVARRSCSSHMNFQDIIRGPSPLFPSICIPQHPRKCLLTSFCKFLLSLWLLSVLLFVLQCLSSNRTFLWIPAPDR